MESIAASPADCSLSQTDGDTLCVVRAVNEVPTSADKSSMLSWTRAAPEGLAACEWDFGAPDDLQSAGFFLDSPEKMRILSITDFSHFWFFGL
jgi:hypothetical protein